MARRLNLWFETLWVDLQEAYDLFALRRWCDRHRDADAAWFVAMGMIPGLTAYDFTHRSDKLAWSYLADILEGDARYARKQVIGLLPEEITRLSKLWDELQKEEYAPDADTK